ncbi:MAG: tRNA lysidine(34) synthetase TilS [Rhizobium sp.]|nr:tRNA lysidine(34) synthetase TilS [Rhizobium sp.]
MAAPLAAGSLLPELSPEAAIDQFLGSLHRPTRLMVAVSGGSDSLGLLLSLKRAIDTRSYAHTHVLVAATVDHGLRPAASGEARQVGAVCENLGIPHRIEHWTGTKPTSGLSAAAREARYRLLADAAEVFHADMLVTGHTLDDQIETIAMRADRSAEGSIGLAGMAPATLYAGRLWILRPFLNTRRMAIRAFLETTGQGWIDDPSNDDISYERVRTRRSIPTIDPRDIDAAGKRREFLSVAAALWLNRHAMAEPGPVVAISLDDAQGAPSPAEREHALGALIAVIGGKPHRPAAESLARLTTALDKGSDFRLTLSGTLALRRRDRLWLVRERRGVLPLALAPQACGIWDGRYAIVNGGEREITVTAGPAEEIASHLPGSIRTALAGNAPQIAGNEGVSRPDAQAITITPRLSLFADFMPGFDQPLADAIARLMGAQASPACPI